MLMICLLSDYIMTHKVKHKFGFMQFLPHLYPRPHLHNRSTNDKSNTRAVFFGLLGEHLWQKSPIFVALNCAS